MPKSTQAQRNQIFTLLARIGSCQLELLKPGRRLLKEGPLLKLPGGRFGAAVVVTRMRYFYLLTVWMSSTSLPILLA